MKSIIVKSQVENAPESKYPYLGYYRIPSGDFIVLFTESRTGTVVQSQNLGRSIGYTGWNWEESLFEVFNGTIELSN